MSKILIEGKPVLYVAPPTEEHKKRYTYYARCTIDGELTGETTYEKAAAAVRKHIKNKPSHDGYAFVSYFPGSGP